MPNPNSAIFEKPATLRSRVEEYLRSSIAEGRMKGGERLREQELCEQLGISRSTLREALRTLEAERLISIEPHRGPTVIRITEKAAQDMRCAPCWRASPPTNSPAWPATPISIG